MPLVFRYLRDYSSLGDKIEPMSERSEKKRMIDPQKTKTATNLSPENIVPWAS